MRDALLSQDIVECIQFHHSTHTDVWKQNVDTKQTTRVGNGTIRNGSVRNGSIQYGTDI